jgi:hypothetical protein
MVLFLIIPLALVAVAECRADARSTRAEPGYVPLGPGGHVPVRLPLEAARDTRLDRAA